MTDKPWDQPSAVLDSLDLSNPEELKAFYDAIDSELEGVSLVGDSPEAATARLLAAYRAVGVYAENLAIAERRLQRLKEAKSANEVDVVLAELPFFGYKYSAVSIHELLRMATTSELQDDNDSLDDTLVEAGHMATEFEYQTDLLDIQAQKLSHEKLLKGRGASVNMSIISDVPAVANNLGQAVSLFLNEYLGEKAAVSYVQHTGPYPPTENLDEVRRRLAELPVHVGTVKVSALADQFANSTMGVINQHDYRDGAQAYVVKGAALIPLLKPEE